MGFDERNWFSYDPDNGFTYFATEEEAVSHAEYMIGEYGSDGEWHEQTGQIVVGKVTHTALECDHVTRDMLDENQCYGGRYYPGDYDSYSDYKMEKVTGA